MAIVKCKECGAQVSTKAEACPACGAPAPKPKVRAKAIFWATSTILLFPFVVGYFGTEQDAQSISTNHTEMPSQARSSVKTESELRPSSAEVVHLDEAPIRKISSVSVNGLHSAYDENEVSADMLYGNSLVKINGSVASIDMSITNKAVVRIGSVEDPYRIVVAQLDDSEKNKAAKLTKGQDVHVLCEHIRKLISSLAGYKCILLDKEIAESTP